MTSTRPPDLDRLLRDGAARLHAPPDSARVRRAMGPIRNEQSHGRSAPVAARLIPVRPWLVAACVVIAGITAALAIRPNPAPPAQQVPPPTLGLAGAIDTITETIKHPHVPDAIAHRFEPARRMLALAQPGEFLIGLRDSLDSRARVSAGRTFTEPARLLQRVAESLSETRRAHPPTDVAPDA